MHKMIPVRALIVPDFRAYFIEGFAEKFTLLAFLFTDSTHVKKTSGKDRSQCAVRE